MKQPEIWQLIEPVIAKDWTHLSDLYEIVGRSITPEEPERVWKRNVRNLLQRRKSTGEVEWDGNARYRLKSQGTHA